MKKKTHWYFWQTTCALVLLLMAAGMAFPAQAQDISKRIKGFDAYMKKILRDWNAPGIGVGIVSGDRLVFAKGYGFRDLEKRLPITPQTLFQIASNTKLFTAVACGMLVKEGKLAWDQPVRESVPAIRFYNDALNNSVTLRDMLGHRTGITRHDMIWYQSDFSRQELFERLKYLEPKEPLRQTFIYNNMMYAGAGRIIELLSGQSWEEFVRERIFNPLSMKSSCFSVADMLRQPDHTVHYTEKRDTADLYKIPYYEDTAGVAPAGAIISNIDDLSRWLIALMNDGKHGGRQVLPADVLRSTLEPGIALPNTNVEIRGFYELLNETYGMGRETAVYRGHLLTFHGGDIDGIHSQVSVLPRERLGAIVFVIGDHCSVLYDIISYNVYERLLGLTQTPWSERLLEITKKAKQAGTESRSKAGVERVPGTSPSHALADYAGRYEHPAYGILKIGMKEGRLQFEFHKMILPLTHFHYDRFDTPNDERFGVWSLNFGTNPQGDIDRILMSLDEAETVFTRKPEPLDTQLLQRLAGPYETATGFKIQVTLKEDGNLYAVVPGQPEQMFVHVKGLTFRLKEFSDMSFEFIMENDQVKGIRRRDPGGERFIKRL